MGFEVLTFFAKILSTLNASPFLVGGDCCRDSGLQEQRSVSLLHLAHLSSIVGDTRGTDLSIFVTGLVNAEFALICKVILI